MRRQIEILVSVSRPSLHGGHSYRGQVDWMLRRGESRLRRGAAIRWTSQWGVKYASLSASLDP